ncbi:hypothetical protein A5886_001475 [Enterococcus sp. 8G7_MSG3316]|uniref:Uncharacterized protein n=1 Tax=Candidatus Enterococcus testudinis TaxID=1834191 RepID=A0A242A5T5_9ENTE|nr:hypothetical protein [Enterococcus sp. 8G7_MSG3316]OTN76398.1 hypothetical protein A5886_001475 [Enterococcus sp. 8G7_MSG3316]
MTKKGEYEPEQLKFAVSEIPGLSAPNVLNQSLTKDNWLILSDFDGAASGEVSFETSLHSGKAETDYGLRISLQRDLKVSENDESEIKENVLDESTHQVIVAPEHLTLAKNTTTSTTTTTNSIVESDATQSSSTVEATTESTEQETQNILRIAGFEGTTAETFIANYPNIDIKTKSDGTGVYPNPSQPEGTTVLNPVGVIMIRAYQVRLLINGSIITSMVLFVRKVMLILLFASMQRKLEQRDFLISF